MLTDTYGRQTLASGVIFLGDRPVTVSPLTGDDCRLLMSELHRLTGRRRPTPEQQSQQLYNPAGCCYLVWLSARKHHPRLCLEDIEPLVTDANVVQILADVSRATQAVTATA